MNFGEGAKRIYIALFSLVTAGYIAAQFSEFPNVDRIYSSNVYDLKKAIADDWNKENPTSRIESYEIKWDSDSDKKFVENTCNAPKSSEPGIAKQCGKVKQEIEGLTRERLEYAGQTVGVAAGIGFGATLFWMLLAWIGRGFIKQKT